MAPAGSDLAGIADAEASAVLPAGELADEHWEYQRATSQLWNIDRCDVHQVAEWEELARRVDAWEADTTSRMAHPTRELTGPDPH